VSGFLSSLISGGGSGLGWLDRFLRPASIGGRGFYVETAEEGPGRRWVTHEFPGRDDPWHEDLGQRTHAFTIEGFLIGDDVAYQAGRFRELAKSPKALLFIHPWLGEQNVVIQDLRIRFAIREGRIARLSFKLEKAGPRPAPLINLDGITAVIQAVEDAIASVTEAVGRVRSIIGAADYVIGSVVGMATGIVGFATSALSGFGLLGALSTTATARAFDQLAGVLSDDDVNPPALAPLVTQTFREISNLAGDRAAITGSETVFDRPTDTLEALLSLAENEDLVPVVSAGTTEGDRLLAEIGAALRALALAAAAAEAARAATAVGWESRDEALAARDRIADVLDGAADRVAALGWDTAWRDLVTLRAATIADISARAAPLPRIATLILPASIPSCLLAYQLDGDALGTVFDRGMAIAARNRLPHPGFVPAGRPIEVLL